MPSSPAPAADQHLSALDGWRGISIILVLAAHLLPLGPKSWQLNDTAGLMGMALFFTLSGFLITRFLLRNTSVTDFLIRRFFRIVPLAWVALIITLPLIAAPGNAYLPNFLFYANLPPQHLTEVASHFWSLCVEVQFYIGIALLVRMFGTRGLYLLPLICIGITAHRIGWGAEADIVTWRRADEILAGTMLAMTFDGRFGTMPIRVARRLNAYLLGGLLMLCSHPGAGTLNYLRPYAAALLVAASLFNSPSGLNWLLNKRSLAYLAKISYAVYITHHLLMFTWLGSGPGWIKYAKRPLLFALTAVLSHLSTVHFEQRFIDLGHRLSARLRSKPDST